MQKTASNSVDHVPPQVRKAIGAVYEYLWDEELENFVSHADQDTRADVDEHVFVALCRLRTYFEGQKHDPMFYLAKAADPDAKTPDTRFVIDRGRNVVFEAQSQEYVGELLQTTVGQLRDETGNVIGLEVLHSCKRPDGQKFGIDASVLY